MNTNIDAVVSTVSNRCYAILEQRKDTFMDGTPDDTKYISVETIGVTTFTCDEGSITAVSITPIGAKSSKSDYFIIKSYPATITLDLAYALIDGK